MVANYGQKYLKHWQFLRKFGIRKKSGMTLFCVISVTSRISGITKKPIHTHLNLIFP
jgi:hypothetical protein